MVPSPFSARVARPASVPALVLGLFAGCTAVQRESLEPEEVRAALAARSDGPVFELDPRDLAGLEALALPRPSREECADPTGAGFWRACALAWNPAVRTARYELEGALAAADVAGRPATIEAMGEVMDFGDVEAESKVGVTFDLLALAGVGPPAAAREEARARWNLAQAGFESAVWTATFEVLRARVRLAASRERVARLEALLGGVLAELPRFEVLERRGRLSAAEAAMVYAAPHEVEHALSAERANESALRAALARESGLAFAHAALDAVGSAALGERASEPPLELELWRDHPTLRRLTLEFAAAEAGVRAAAARAWPELRAGPQLLFLPSEVLLGGLLDVSFPWPGNVEREVRERAAARGAARARVEDGLLAAEAAVLSLRTVAREADLRAEEHALELESAAADNWDAVAAKLQRNQAGVQEWMLALTRRLETLLSLANEQEAARLAALDLAEASGAAPAAGEDAP